MDEHVVKPLFQQRRTVEPVHGELEYEAAVRCHQCLFAGNINFAVGIGIVEGVDGVAAGMLSL